MDNWLIARYQSIVNQFQHKTLWWIEQCAYLLLLGAIGRFAFRTTHSLYEYFTLLVDMVVVSLTWYAGRHEHFAQHMFGRQNSLARLGILTISMVFMGLDLLILLLGAGITPHQIASDVAQIAFISAFYFGACEDPPPPKRQEKMAFEGGGL